MMASGGTIAIGIGLVFALALGAIGFGCVWLVFTVIARTARFFSHCGQSQARGPLPLSPVCPNRACRRHNRLGSRFCGRCGAPLQIGVDPELYV